jgi:hypothetical protein
MRQPLSAINCKGIFIDNVKSTKQPIPGIRINPFSRQIDRAMKLVLSFMNHKRAAISCFCLALTAFGFTQHNIVGIGTRRSCNNLSLSATSPTSIDWKACAQPNFDEFASYTVGPWIQALQSPDVQVTQYEVEEVMRSCGGAVQGIRELPLHLIFPNENAIKETGQRTYHNRADGGFVYINDGSYSAGPEKFDFDQSDEDMEKLFMSSFSFGKHRLLMTSTLESVSDAVKQCSSNGIGLSAISNAAQIKLSWTTSASQDIPSQQDEVKSIQSSEISWNGIVRVRMPNASQLWSLARAKWEKTTLSTNENELSEPGNRSGQLGSAEVELVSEINPIFGDLVGKGSIVKMRAVSRNTHLARTSIRCYDNSGQLKSVAFLEGVMN